MKVASLVSAIGLASVWFGLHMWTNVFEWSMSSADPLLWNHIFWFGVMTVAAGLVMMAMVLFIWWALSQISDAMGI